MAAQAKADKEAKAAANKKKKEDADAAVVAQYKNKQVKAPNGEGEEGKSSPSLGERLVVGSSGECKCSGPTWINQNGTLAHK